MSLCVSKDGDARFMGQLDFGRLIERSLRRSGVPVQYSQGFNPRIRLSFADALPLGVASTGEWIALILTEDLPPEDFRAKLEPALPMQGTGSVRVVDVRRGSPPTQDAGPIRYSLDVLSEPGSVADALTALLERDEYHVTDPRRNRTMDARSFFVAGSLEKAAPDADVLARLDVELVAVNGRPPRPGLIASALVELAKEAGDPVPDFGLFTKQVAVQLRQGAQDPWQDAAAVAAAPQARSCSSTPANRKRAGSPSSKPAASTSTTSSGNP
jgi:radical SAM-linked protein